MAAERPGSRFVQKVLASPAMSDDLTALVTGLAVGDKVAGGSVRVIPNVAHIRDFQPGEILVTTTAAANPLTLERSPGTEAKPA